MGTKLATFCGDCGPLKGCVLSWDAAAKRMSVVSPGGKSRTMRPSEAARADGLGLLEWARPDVRDAVLASLRGSDDPVRGAAVRAGDTGPADAPGAGHGDGSGVLAVSLTLGVVFSVVLAMAVGWGLSSGVLRGGDRQADPGGPSLSATGGTWANEMLPSPDTTQAALLRSLIVESAERPGSVPAGSVTVVDGGGGVSGVAPLVASVSGKRYGSVVSTDGAVTASSEAWAKDPGTLGSGGLVGERNELSGPDSALLFRVSSRFGTLSGYSQSDWMSESGARYVRISTTMTMDGHPDMVLWAVRPEKGRPVALGLRPAQAKGD